MKPLRSQFVGGLILEGIGALFLGLANANSIGINPPSSSVLWNPTITVSGPMSDSTDYTLWVNGTKATLNGDGTWSAANVYLPAGGTVKGSVREGVGA